MIDTGTNVREHYSAAGLTGRIQSLLAALAPEGQTLTFSQLAPWISFISGILATSELASAAGIVAPSMPSCSGFWCQAAGWPPTT